MKRSSISFLAAAALIALIGILGLLQYTWLVQASEADGEKMHKRLNSDTEHFAADFNREIQDAYFNFQIDADRWKRRDWDEFNERYDYWRSKTAYPDLIAKVIFIEADPAATALAYNAPARKFEATQLAPEIEQLRQTFGDDQKRQTVYDEIPALVIPVHSMPERFDHLLMRRTMHAGPPPELAKKYGYLVVVLNKDVLTTRVLPDLVNKYFPDDEYRLSVTDLTGQVFQARNGTTDADASAKLFDLSGDKFVFFQTKDLLPAEPSADKLSVGTNEVYVTRKMESRTKTPSADDGQTKGSVRIEVDAGERPRTAVIERTNSVASSWTLQVQHRAGSVNEFIAQRRRTSLGIGFGLLLLLGTGIALVFFSAERARRLAQRQVDFVSSVSHEFRTPLAVIYSAGENLVDGVASEPSQVMRYGQLIKGEGRKLSSMVEQILEYAGARSGSVKFELADLDASDLVLDAIASSRPMLDENGFDVNTRITPHLPRIKGDREALSRAIQNLIANSVKYSNGTNWMRISAENGDGRIKISVEDKGIGLSKNDLRRVFDPFYRARSAVDSQIHGNGLGLSVVRRTAEGHGGRVYATSTPGKGSIFTLEIPVQRADGEETRNAL